jgi:multiple sugar transport system substrate-binding protein
MTTSSRRLAAVLAAVVTLGGLTACGGGPANTANGPIQYWLWDSAQQPGYQKCADQFEQQNPGIKINISQIGWTD